MNDIDLKELADAPHWFAADLVVERHIRATLAEHPTKAFTTTQLAGLILGAYVVAYKAEYLPPLEGKAQKAFFGAVKSKRLPSHALADCARRDDNTKLVAGKLVHGWLWSHPAATKEEWE